MGANMQDLDRRIRSVSNTRKITKAMEMVAAAKLRRAQLRIEKLRPFADAMLELTVTVANGIQAGLPIPLLEEREIKTACIVMFTGDRGLAGALNANVLRRSLQLKEEYESAGAEVRFVGVGKKGVSSLQFRKLPVDNAYRGITDWPQFRDAEAIGQNVITEFANGTYDKVIMVYNHFESAVTQHVVVQDMLPLSDELLVAELSRLAEATHQLGEHKNHRKDLTDTSGAKVDLTDVHIRKRDEEGTVEKQGHRADWMFEPDAESLLNRLLPTYVEQAVFRALLESTASEHGARMSAMRNASENAVEIIDNLTLQRNRARQAEITQEILEVVAGAEALG
jgi:F-type H+-transporting ATPase subunit gamma